MGNFLFNQQIPGMIEAQEQYALGIIARDLWHGVGEIVEVGVLAGLSTSCIAQGMRDNPKVKLKTARFHVFDLFRTPGPPLYAAYAKMIQGIGEPGADFRPIFEKNVQAWRDLIVVHEGDACEGEWDGKPIEIMHVDASAGHRFHVKLALKFFPSLVPGAILIHQDFFYHRSWYLAPMMMRLERFFEPQSVFGTSFSFRLKQPLSLRDILHENVHKSHLSLLDQAIEQHGGYRQKMGAFLASAKVFYFATHGEREKAGKLAGEILAENQNDRVRQNVEAALAA
jgi:hypothetical protein